MHIKTLSYTIDEMQALLTEQTHYTLRWLRDQDIVDEETCDYYQGRLLVVGVTNKSIFGKVRDWMFGDTPEDENTIKFQITEIHR